MCMKKKMLYIFFLFSILLVAQPNSTLTENQKIYTLSKVWSDVKQNFVYYNKLKINWDSTYIATIEQAKKTKTDYQFYKLMRRFVALLKDGHSNFYFPKQYYKKYLGSPEIETKLIENKVFITYVKNDSLVKIGLKKGLEILSINNIPVKEYANKNINPFISASTKQDLLNRQYRFHLLFGLISDTLSIKTQDFYGHKNSYKLARKLRSSKRKKSTFVFKEVNKNVGLLEINNFYDKDFEKKFDSIFSLILKTNALIIDLRNNGGGNSGNAYYVLKHISKRAFLTSFWRTRKYMPAFISWGYKEDWYAEEAEKIKPIKGKKFKKPTVVLTSINTFSAAEDFCIAYKQMKRGKIIGSKTAGSTGNPMFFKLPDSSAYRICTKEDRFADGRVFVGKGILPTIQINETIDNFKNNIDAVLNRALLDLTY